MEKLKTDVLIIGAGVAGCSLAIFLKRAKTDFLIFEKSVPGGKLNQINKITNYVGINEISGPDLAVNIFNQMNSLNVNLINEEILDLKKDANGFILTSSSYVVTSKIVVIATGVSMRDIKIKNYDKFYQKGISTCALCDGYLYHNKKIAVIGNSDIAKKEYLYLSNLTKDIVLIDNEKDKAIEFIGEEKLKGIKTEKGIVYVDAAFVYLKESFDYLLTKDLNIATKNNHIIVDENFMTSVDNVFAIGDSIQKKIYQIIGAINDANFASVAIINKLKNE